MKVSASVLLLSAALGVSAHPSGHAHLHNKRDFVVARKPDVTQTAPAATSASSDDSAGYVAFCGGATSKRATTEEIAYKGNTGTSSNYGCNIMTVSSSVADKYDYTATFTNSVAKDQACVCWNKIGPDGGINGFWKGNQAISFTLPASGSQTVAFDSNTQGGCACSVGSEVATTFIGQFASTWLEVDFDNTSNGGWSGADASCLVSAAGSQSIPALKVCFDGTCSTINTGGTGTNAYLAGMEAADGVGLNINAGTKVALAVTVGQ